MVPTEKNTMDEHALWQGERLLQQTAAALERNSMPSFRSA